MSASTQIAPPAPESITDPLAVPAWKREINARLDAHRSRREAFPDAQPALPGMDSAMRASRTQRVARRVAERYAHAPSYREMLAAEAAKAAHAAEAAAEAARAAHEAAMAVTDVLRSDPTANAPARKDSPAEDFFTPAQAPPAFDPVPELQGSAPQYRVDPSSLPLPRRDRYAASGRRSGDLWTDEPLAQQSVELDPVVVDPLEEALVAPAEPLPARVLEFPRELIAPRKARPHSVEGPLRDAAPDADPSQLRIFEVETEAISHEPESAAPEREHFTPTWAELRLDAAPPAAVVAEPPVIEEQPEVAPAVPQKRQAAPHAAYAPHSLLEDMLLLHVAPFEDRLMATVVDGALVGCAFLAFVLIFVASTPHPPVGKPAMAAAVVTFFVFAALYQALFFLWGDATPGMRYAKIALCTFEDENPSRAAMQKRVGALLLSAVPLGLGFLWALLDDDRLSWHDRMTRTYQRSYK